MIIGGKNELPSPDIRPKRREVEDRPRYGYYKSNSRALNKANARSAFFYALGKCISHCPQSCRNDLMDAYKHLWETSPPLQYARFSYDPFIRQIFETIIRADSDAAWHEQEGATPREKN
jgi:hypothetical protein